MRTLCEGPLLMGILLSEIGEKKFLHDLFSKIKCSDYLINGFGDDASIIDIGLSDENLVFKIDRIPTPYAYSRGFAGSEIFGRLSVVANFSDILAVGGRPVSFMLSLLIEKSSTSEFVEKIIMAASKTANEYGAFLSGGDTKEGKVIEVVGAAIGLVKKDMHWTRTGAKPGDFVVITGEVGSFMASIATIENNIRDKDVLEKAMEYLSKPKIAYDEAMLLRQFSSGISSAMDLSDGLGEGVRELSYQNNLGIQLDSNSLPISSLANNVANSLNTKTTNMAFGAGDWNLLLTIKPSYWDPIITEFQDKNFLITKIGEMSYEKSITLDGEIANLPIHEHFKLSFSNTREYLEHVIYNKVI